jgi:hypothetical protein
LAKTDHFKLGARTAAPAAAAESRSSRRRVKADERGQTTPVSRAERAKAFLRAENNGVRDIAITTRL